uniref:glutathione S-transferase T3-like n=1 Tax=Erigeron canadensis TaxID=72917 RepID=UPI001CB89D41|nr:glutathione S-transferase T3-like [Erigeron canadensis]
MGMGMGSVIGMGPGMCMGMGPGMGMGGSSQHETFGGSSSQQNTPGSFFDRQRLVDTPPQDSQDDDVQKTQPPPQPSKPRRHRKKVVGEDEPRPRNVQQTWLPSEEMNLATAWLSVIENPECANYQKKGVYWSRITEALATLEEKPKDYRDPEVVSAKWRKIRLIIQNFNQIYTRIGHASGENDLDRVRKANEEYEGTYHKPFPYSSIWGKIRYSSKFYLVDKSVVRTNLGEPTAKRSKTSSSTDPVASQGSDARVNFDLNSFEELGDNDDEPVYQERPIGRDASKKASRSGSSSGGKGKRKGKYMETFEGIAKKLDKLFDMSSKKIELKEKKVKIMEEDRDWKLLGTEYSHLEEPERSIMERKKQALREKYLS